MTEIKNIDERLKTYMYQYTKHVAEERAIPDIRDGFFPVERRIIYSMYSYSKLTHDKRHGKSNPVVGGVLGQFHPHSDVAVYGSMMKLAQWWKNNITYVEISGSVGDINGATYAASRYTEARLTKAAEHTYSDLKYETVQMKPNYLETLDEPTVLPNKIPSLLINGKIGIAVGYSTSIPPHNYHDIIRLHIAYNKNRKMTVDEMIDIIKAPDFPSGGIINGMGHAHSIYRTGKGSITVRGEVLRHYDEKKGRYSLEIKSFPPDVTYDEYIQSVYNLEKSGLIRLSDSISDFSGKNGTSIIIPLHKSENVNRVEAMLYKKTSLETSSSATMYALVNGIPTLCNLPTMVEKFIEFREEVIYNRMVHIVSQLELDLELQIGLRIVEENIDEILKIVKSSKSDVEAKAILMPKYGLSDRQAEYVLEFKIRRLVGLDKIAICKKIDEIKKEIEDLKGKTLSIRDNKHIIKIIDEELKELLKLKPDNGRKCSIIEKKVSISELDAIKEEPRMIILTRKGRLKVMEVKDSSQGRGGTGQSFMGDKEDEPVLILDGKTTDSLLCFTNKGKIYKVPLYKIEVSSKVAKGNLAKTELGLTQDEEIVFLKSVEKSVSEDACLIFVTKNGLIKSTKYTEYSSITSAGKKAIKLEGKDTLVSVELFDKTAKDMIITTHSGSSIKIDVTTVNTTGRDTSGVKAKKLRDETDFVVSAKMLTGDSLYFISEDGKIKCVDATEFRTQTRGGAGVNTGDKIIDVIVDDTSKEIIGIYTQNGMSININKSSIRQTSRTATGVKGIKLNKNDKVVQIIQI